VLAEEGWNLRARHDAAREGGNQSSPPLGMHGYDPRLPSMHGILIGRGPGLATATRVGSIENVHLYELMSRLLSIEPARNDGRLAAVKGMLARSAVDKLTEAARATATR
jgi:hypothetical protein